jgi:IS5 family transposase
LQPYDKACAADSVYPRKKNKEILVQRNIENLILNLAYRNKPLSLEEKQKNQKILPIRSIVERIFGILKLYCGMRKARYLGLEYNKMRLSLTCIIYNIKIGLRIFNEIMQYKSA